VALREKKGPFRTLFGLTRDLDLRSVNKKALESLARVGALDDLEGHRAQLAEAVDAAMQYAQKAQADAAAGQNSLFGGGVAGGAAMEPNLPITEPWPRAQLLKEERELVGFYVSGHPLEAYMAEAQAFATAEVGKVEDLDLGDPDVPSYGPNRPQYSFCGIITGVQRRTTKSGKPIAFAEFEDFTGQAELVCFSSVYDRVQNYLQVDATVLVRGHVEVRGGSVKVIVQDVLPMWKVREQLAKALVLRLDLDRLEEAQVEQLGTLCDANRGHCKLYFDLYASDLPQPQRVRSRNYVVDLTPDLMQGINRLFGRENVVLEGES
jgi:DNA polymerase-3 subunit alpha